MLEKLLNDAQIIAVICAQWGDTGKGKFSDLFASQWADVTARGTGGNNAGHTVVVNGKQKVFHLIPAGISNDSRGKITLLGNGMAIDLAVLNRELDALDSEGRTYNHLMISDDAQVIMPYQVQRDIERNQSQRGGGIGSTGRGIGPCYADKIARRGIRIGDLFDRDVLAKGIRKARETYHEQEIIEEQIIEELHPLADRIKPFVRDTVSEIHRLVEQGKKILLEGAQGILLSVEHGTYPYVTSSDCSLNGTASGVGLSARAVDLPLSIVKFPFMTRVGGGPFPTELGGTRSEEYCAEETGHTKKEELSAYGIPHQITERGIIYQRNDPTIISMMNSDDEFTRGVGIRLAAEEYGATTGRPRRIGWTDSVAARYAVRMNGPNLILTKADSLSGANEFKVAYSYQTDETTTNDFPRRADTLRKVTPQLKTYRGYGEIKSIREYEELPHSLKEAIVDLEEMTKGKVRLVSVGADREETIIV